MPIATPEVYAEMLGRAKEHAFAFPAINCTSSSTINAAIKGFADAGSDGIIQFSTGGAEFGSGLGIKEMVTGAVALAACGLTALTAMTTANAMVQMRTDPVMRGRVMALYMAIFFGGTPIGAPLIGWVGDVLGPRWTIGIGSIAVGVALVGAWVWLRMVHDLSVTFDRHRPWITVAVPAPSMPVRRALDPEPVR